jgi:hypothetical protein
MIIRLINLIYSKVLPDKKIEKSGNLDVLDNAI